MAEARDKLRLFFALQPAAGLNLALVDAVGPLVEQLQGQRVPPANLHATLCFIGATAAEDLDRLRDVGARQRGRRMTLCFDSLEYWQKPRILCATAQDDSGAGVALAENLARTSRAAGFAPDVKNFRAHLTLARKVQARLAARVDWPRPLAPVVMNFDRFVLMESRRGESGSIYSVVDSWPLYAADTD